MRFNTRAMVHCVACVLAGLMGFLSTARAGLDRWSGHVTAIDAIEASTILGAEEAACGGGIGGTGCKRSTDDACAKTKNCADVTSTCRKFSDKLCYSITMKKATYPCKPGKKDDTCCVDPESACMEYSRGRPFSGSCNSNNTGLAICLIKAGECGTPIYKKCDAKK